MTESPGNLRQVVHRKPPELVVVHRVSCIVIGMGTVEPKSLRGRPRSARVLAPKRPPHRLARFAEPFEKVPDGRTISDVRGVEELLASATDDAGNLRAVPEHIRGQASLSLRGHLHRGTFSDSTCGSTAQ